MRSMDEEIEEMAKRAHEKGICPKCGSEMERSKHEAQSEDCRYSVWSCQCGHEEKVDDNPFEHDERGYELKGDG